MLLPEWLVQFNKSHTADGKGLPSQNPSEFFGPTSFFERFWFRRSENCPETRAPKR